MNYWSHCFYVLIDNNCCFFKGVVVLADPSTACDTVKPLNRYNQSGYSAGNWFLLIDEGVCDFDKKVILRYLVTT